MREHDQRHLREMIPGVSQSAAAATGSVSVLQRRAAVRPSLPATDPLAASLIFGDAVNAGVHHLQLQAAEPSGDTSGPQVQAIAARGVSGSGVPLPHLREIQRAFGHHDVSAVRAHVGGPATAASAAIGAHAYAAGNDVAFAGAPDLHLAAHEAAHVVQQRGGVRLSGGVGRAGDAYEVHADAVADAVVRGESAQALLDDMAHRGAGGGSAVQLREDSDYEAREYMRERPPAAQEHSAVTLADVRALVTRIAGGVVTGQFADVRINCRIPIPEVPGLSLTIGIGGSIAVGSNRQKELNCSLSGGAMFGLGSVFNINANVNGALQLTGEDLGAALVDCLKQSTHVALRNAGVDQRLNELVQMARNPQTCTQQILAFGVDQLTAVQRAYVAFFADNGAVGFSASIGVQAGVGVSSGNRGLSAALEARVGLENRAGDRETHAFTELAGQVQGNVGNSQATVRYSKHMVDGGATTCAVEVNGQVSMPARAWAPEGTRTFMSTMRDGLFVNKIVTCARALANAQDGASLGEAMAVVSSSLALGSATFGNPGAGFDSLMGIEVRVSNTVDASGQSRWTVDRARFKSMTQLGTGTGVEVGGVTANVQIGTFIDGTAAVNDGIHALAGDAPAPTARR